MDQRAIDPNGRSKKFSRNKDEKVRRIIETTFQLIAEKEYDNLTTNHIAEAANVSIGTIYRYFPEGKAAIVLAVAEDMYQKLPVEELLRDVETNNLQELVSTFIRFYVKYHRDNYRMIKATEKASLSSRAVRDDIDSFIKQNLDNFLVFFKKFPMLTQFTLEEVQNKISIMIKAMDSIIHRHLLISPIFKTDEDLIAFLVDLSVKLVENSFMRV